MDSYHVRFGRHSNIPDCCIWFFLSTWKGWENDPFLDRDYRRAANIIGKNAGYVICPTCLLNNNIKKIHKCYQGCGFDIEKEIRRFKNGLSRKRLYAA